MSELITWLSSSGQALLGGILRTNLTTAVLLPIPTYFQHETKVEGNTLVAIARSTYKLGDGREQDVEMAFRGEVKQGANGPVLTMSPSSKRRGPTLVDPSCPVMRGAAPGALSTRRLSWERAQQFTLLSMKALGP